MHEGTKNIMRLAGFGMHVTRVELGLCPLCGKEIAYEDFRDDLSKREYDISGMCQSCQDEVFHD